MQTDWVSFAEYDIGRKPMIITTLVENTRLENREDLIAEHGLSLHISRNAEQILFDTGASESFSSNAEKLGIDISGVNRVVLSHHHFDHGGGLARFLEVNKDAKVYLRSLPDGDCHFRALGILNRYIGLDKGLFQSNPDRFEFVDEFTEISADVFIITNIGSSYPLPKGNRYLYLKRGTSRILDNFEHELIMVIRDSGGLVVFTGCSHNGMLNMIDTVARQFKDIPIKAVIGGFHLVGLPIFNTMAGSKGEVEDVGREVLKYPIDKVYTGHCTGNKAYAVLKGVLREKIEYLSTGTCIEI